MDNQRISSAVLAWQADNRVHPLMCGTNSTHRPLVPLDEAGIVVLLCLECGYRQAEIPPIVLQAATERTKAAATTAAWPFLKKP